MDLLALALRDARWARRLAVGGVAAVVWFGVGLAWMAGFTSPGYVLAVALEAAIVAVAMVAVPPGATRFAALPAALTLAEAVRLRWPFGGFPLAAIGQVDGPLLAIAALGGGLLVTALVGVGGVALAALLERRAMTAAIASAVVGFALLGASITTTPQPAARLRVAAVQGGGERGIPGVVADSAAVFDRHLDAAGDVEPPIDLVLLPEDVLDLDGPVADSDVARATGDLARRLDTTVVAGVVEDVGDDHFRKGGSGLGPFGGDSRPGREGAVRTFRRVHPGPRLGVPCRGRLARPPRRDPR